MKAKQKIPCPYCAAQGISMDAAQKGKAIKESDTRYGCGNEHYFAVPTRTVEERAAQSAR